ncbi:MAG: hybrid sensor histidine kinase/response regulator [Candidatus Bathyarchaeota archaeon]|nr:hybrid sensor histidine kinase/response regulator [Candidatus Bathyarchaeota archaeon]
MGLTTQQNQKIHVLHVDDDPNILSVSKDILECDGKFHVQTATCVDEALKKFSQHSFDAIISDYEMPQKNGLQFLEEIRSQKNEIAFVMFTGRGREEVAVKALNLGADRYINKNGDPEAVYCELAYAIEKIVERKKARMQLVEDAEKINQLNEKLRVVGSLTRHDIRNKLTALNGQVYLLKKKTKQVPDAEVHLKEIELVCRQIVELLEFAHIYQKLGAEQLKRVDVEKTVNDAIALFSNINGVKITNQCSGLIVCADSLLRQLFYNLIDNSIRHGQRTTKICIRYEDDGSQVKLIYEDDGAGIPANLKNSLFDEKTSRGANHGLYVVRRICEAYKWSVKEVGEAGLGVKFLINIPNSCSKLSPL